MDARDQLIAISHQLAAAISRRDTETVSGLLAPGFLHRTVGGGSVAAGDFLRGIQQIPGELQAVEVDRIAVDLRDEQAIVTGIQSARLILEGKAIEDRRGFVDWFVRQPEGWRLLLAIDFVV